MADRKARIEQVIVGVITQAFADARTDRFTSTDDYVVSLCERAGGIRGDGLTVDPASKTELLLGLASQADLYPLGDLYATQIGQLTGQPHNAPALAELAATCGGAETLDRVLADLFDRRQGPDSAAAGLSLEARRLLEERLEAARFRRTRVGLVPKLGARTLGIDLFA